MPSRRNFLMGLASVGAGAATAGPLVAGAVSGVRPTHDLADFDAVGDGVADDTAALQALIDATAADGRVGVVPAGTYRCTSSLMLPARAGLRLEQGSLLLKDWAAAPGLANAFMRNEDFAVRSDAVRITGPGKIGARDHSQTGVIIAIYGNGVRLRDFTVDTYAGGQAIMFAGNRGRIDQVTVTNSAQTFGTGGIRMIGGSDFVATGCHVESGDDCFQFVPIGEPTALLYDMSIRRSAYRSCTGSSSASRFLVALLEWTGGEGGMQGSVSDCSFVDCHGTAANRGIVVKNTHSSGAVERVRFTDCSVDMARSEDREAQEIRIQTDPTSTGAVRDIRFTRTHITNPVNATLRTGGPNISGITFDSCAFTPPSGAAATVAVVDATATMAFVGCTFDGAPDKRPLTVGPTAPVTGLRVQDCQFTGIGDGVTAVNLIRATDAVVERSGFVATPGATTARAVRVSAESSQVVLRDNDLTSLAVPMKIVDQASDTLVTDNAGYLTLTSGTVAVEAGDRSVTVVHGLGGTGRVPTASNVTLVPTSSAAATSGFFLGEVTAGTFTIELATAPVGNAATFTWQVDVTRL